MKTLFKTGWLFGLVICAQIALAHPRVKPDLPDMQIDTNRAALLQKINTEKTRIAANYKGADSRFLNLTDSVAAFILRQPVNGQKQSLYLARLLSFLSNINRYYSDSYFKSGIYLAALGYYPMMIEWDERDELGTNLKRYSSFSIKATRLIPSDAVAEEYLASYTTDHPDDVFRYTEEFEDRKFALRLLERAVKLAPESAKRYYPTVNVVSNILVRSRDLYVRKSIELYEHFGIKSHSYILLDAVVKDNLRLDAADSIGNNQQAMFRYLVQLSARNDALVTYSIYRYLSDNSAEIIRKINQQAVNDPAYNFASFRQLSADEMFTLLCYGFKETTTKNFQAMLEILRKKAGDTPLSNAMIATMDKWKMKDFVLYCTKNKVFDGVLSLVNDEKRDYLLALLTLQEKEDLMPPFKTFAKESPVIAKARDESNVAPVAKASAPKAVAEDTVVVVKQPVKAQAVQKTEPAPVVAAPVPAPVVKTEHPGVVDNQLSKPVKSTTVIEPIKSELAPAPTTVIKKKDEIVSLPSANASTLKSPVVKTSSEAPAKVDNVPLPPPEPVIEPIKINLDDRTRTILSLKKNIFQTIQHIPGFINEDYAEEILMYAARKEPDELLKKIAAFKGKYFCKHILEICAINAPVSVKRYLFNPQLPVSYILQYSQNDQVKKMLELNSHLGYYSKPLLLIDDLYNNRTSLKDAIEISNNPNRLFSAMVKIISRPKYIGQYSIDHEMRDYSLRFIREINDKIASGAPQPFSSVEGFNATNLYFLMLYGRDEVFSSTFNGLFDRFLQKLPNDDGEAFLRSVSNNHFREFVSLCANYRNLEEFLSKFSPDAKSKLMSAYISSLETEQDELSTIVLIAEAISNLNDNQVLALVQSTIIKEYERVKAGNNKIGVCIYGVLSSMISGNAKTDARWYKSISQQFQISPATSLASSVLFNDGTNCVEQMYFYNDDDGRSSFVNFMNTYRSQPSWAVEDMNTYIRIYSKAGLKVEILANKPSAEETGTNAITDYLLQKNLVATVIVHRGHSFHTEATLERVLPTAKLIFVGSCGGFYKIPIALENAPDAHIISTKQIGTKTINDVMLFALNENIRIGKDIEWNDFWDKMREKLGSNQYFSDYVPPNKNLEAIFIRAYYKVLGV